MAFEEIIGKVKETASKKVAALDMNISEHAIEAIVKDLESHRELIKSSVIEKAEKEYDIYESTEELIKAASTLAKDEHRETIYEVDIAKAMGNICPTYWPFC